MVATTTSDRIQNENDYSAATTTTADTSPWTHVLFETSTGIFCIELYYKHAPRTCYNLAALAHAGYYDSTMFHRIVRDFMIQGGDPTGTGRGGESIFGKGKLEDEITRNLKHTGAGVVAMANSGQPNSNGSQFYITLQPTPWLDGKHSIFGRISHGMGVIQRMGMVATDANDRPLQPVTIHSARPFRGVPPSLLQLPPTGAIRSSASNNTALSSSNTKRIANEDDENDNEE
ncbi:hypothetical protein ACA910_019511 [Epithemia clementina (nom. ined.)]